MAKDLLVIFFFCNLFLETDIGLFIYKKGTIFHYLFQNTSTKNVINSFKFFLISFIKLDFVKLYGENFLECFSLAF